MNQDNKHVKSLRSIKNSCITDHINYINAYIKENQLNDVKDYQRGVQRYNDVKKLMFDVTLHHPNLMAFLLNPELGLCTDDICREITESKVQIGGTKSDIGEISANKVIQTIEHVKSMFESLKTTDLDLMKKTTDELVSKLRDVERRLSTIDKLNKPVSTDKILNNMTVVIDSLDRFNPSSSSYKKQGKTYDLYVPLKKFEGFDMNKVSTMSNIIGDIISSYLDLFDLKSESLKETIKIVFSSYNAKQLITDLKKLKSDKIVTDTLSKVDQEMSIDSFNSFKSSFVENTIKPMILNEKIEIDSKKIESINKNYTDALLTLSKQQDEVLNLTKQLLTTTSDTYNFLYGTEIDDFAVIRSYIIPKIHEIVEYIKLFIESKPNHDKIEKLKSVVDKYESINPEKRLSDNLKVAVTSIISNLDEYNNSHSLKSILDFVEQCERFEINKKISVISEKILFVELAEFIEFYNSTLNDTTLSVDLNIFVANVYHSVLIKKLGIETKVNRTLQNTNLKFSLEKELLNKNINVIKELNVKKVRDISADNFSGQAIFDELIKKNYSSNKNQSESLLTLLKSDVKLKSMLESEITTEKQAKLFIHTYNVSINKLTKQIDIDLYVEGLPQSIKLIPKTYFLREYTERIYNSMFGNINDNKKQKLDVLSGLVDESITITSKDDVFEKVSMIYKPDFDKIKKLKGGDKSVISNILNLSKARLDYVESIEKYQEASDRYVLAYNDVYSYTRYLILVATNQFFTENYVVYKYLNKGLVEFYKRVVASMIKDLDSGSRESHIVYVRKYYNVIVRKLHVFLKNLSYYLRDSTDLIDIKQIEAINSDLSSTEIRNNLILLNYFKPVIESYNEIFQNQITMYSRINNIVGEIEYVSKVFVSDHEKFKNEGCGYHIINQSKNPVCEPSKTADVDMGGDPTVMWIRNSACSENKSLDSPLIFAEVFDSTNFPENNDISKYMTLETQLAKKKGVCLLTYGYSGTGKTYTLFGNKEKQGILQSTLVNISGLHKVKFRLFELYGLGLPYDFYWNSEKGSRMNDIKHSIFHYNLETTGDSIQVQNSNSDIVIIDPENFLKYMENTYLEKDSYISIKNIKSVFNNFSTFTESIDKYRKGYGNSSVKNIQRIKETPNNPESSRSILVYDFKLYVGNVNKDLESDSDFVRFLIVDLPGREEINQTYIEPYIGNEVVSKMIANKNKSDSTNQQRIKMIITCMVLNPMALAVFQPYLILETVNSLPKNDRKTIYGDNSNGTITEEYTINEIGNKLSLFVNLSPDYTLSSKNRESKGGYGFGYDTDYQVTGVGAVYVVYRLIEQNRFDIIELIYKKIIDVELNDTVSLSIESATNEELYQIIKGLIETRFKGEKTAKTLLDSIQTLIKINIQKGQSNLDYLDSIKSRLIKTDLSSLKLIIKDIIKYDYLLTPLEGIYINENIVGLIKFLSEKLVKDKDTKYIEILDRKKSEQKKMLLIEQRNVARCWLMSKTEEFMNQNMVHNAKTYKTRIDFMKEKLFNFVETYDNSYFSDQKTYFNNVYSGILNYENKNLTVNTEQLIKQQQYLLSTYTSDKIYNFDKPLITDILSPYIDERSNRNKNTIKNYKMFYLFGNYDDDQKTQFKCEHQIKLLNNTDNFIKAISD